MNSGPHQKISLVTCEIGDYDFNENIENEITESICYTDSNSRKAKGWTFRPIPYFSRNAKRSALYVKTHLHSLVRSDVDWIVWKDARITLPNGVGPIISRLISERREADIWLYDHYERSDAIEELAEVTKLALLSKVEQNQARQILQTVKPSGLYETGLFIIPNNQRSRHLLTTWWSLVEIGGVRDQVLLPAAIKKCQSVVGNLNPGFNLRNDHNIIVQPHRTPRYTGQGRVANVGSQSVATIPYVVDERKIRPFEKQVESKPHRKSLTWVIPVHNAIESVKKCLNAVELSLDDTDQVIIVDDGSDEETAHVCQEFSEKTPTRTLIRRAVAGGFTVAANAGLRSANHDILLLNSDTVITPTAVEHLYEALDESSYIAAVGPISNRAVTQSLFEQASISELQNLEKFWGVGSGSNQNVEWLNQILGEVFQILSPTIHVSTLNGFCMLMRKTAVEHVGLFDEEKFPRGYGEETDWTLRAADLGYEFRVSLKSFVYHEKNASYVKQETELLKKRAQDYIRKTYTAERYSRLSESTAFHPNFRVLKELFNQFLNEVY